MNARGFEEVRRLIAAAALSGTLLLSACGGGSTDPDAAPTQGSSTAVTLSETAQLGQQLFNDASLSASGRQSCASCHDPARAHGAPNALAAQFGGPSLDRQGGRQSGSIRYLATNTAFHFADDGTPTGGFFWDGRAQSLQDQAGRPFLNPKEMANSDAADVVAKVARAGYAAKFKALYGEDIFSRPDDAFQRVTLAIAQFEKEEPSFRPFSSKYDEFLRGKVRLSDQELRGLALFNSPAKGNCAACHPSARGSDGSFPLFTDFTYDNLGVPRNAELAQNADPAFYDLGLCAREGGDLAGRPDLCGAFKVPSLRNVAQRGSYFHNGRFKTLKEVLTFYVQRDIHPEKFYPVEPDGTVDKFDDLPAAYSGNVNTTEAPYNRQPGDAPALSDAEIDDVIAFLDTLTDGYVSR